MANINQLDDIEERINVMMPQLDEIIASQQDISNEIIDRQEGIREQIVEVTESQDEIVRNQNVIKDHHFVIVEAQLDQTIQNQGHIRANQDQIKANQDVIKDHHIVIIEAQLDQTIQNQDHIKANQDQIKANQDEIKASRNEEKEKMERYFAGIKRKHDEIDDKVEKTKVTFFLYKQYF